MYIYKSIYKYTYIYIYENIYTYTFPPDFPCAVGKLDAPFRQIAYSTSYSLDQCIHMTCLL